MKKIDESVVLKVIAREPFRVFYEGPAKVVSAANDIGDFDILPGHADFFSILSPGEVLISTNADEPVTIKITNGIAAVRNDEVMLFLNM
jgi:F0F1-type ATP synthase epsilon subunit